MITIFTIPKPFTDPHIRTIQRNALLSWKKISPDIEILVMGNDRGVRETTEEFDLEHVPNIETNEFGTPLLDSAFSTARKKARFETIMYINADIILLPDFRNIFKVIPMDDSLTIGRRIDIDITHQIDFDDSNWEDAVMIEVDAKGALHSYAGIDYFIFNKKLFADLPPFSVGRIGWDNWVVWQSRKLFRYTIDATAMIHAIHQNHGYTGNNVSDSRKTNPEAVKNSSFITSRAGGYTIEDANWKLTPQGKLIRNYWCFIPPLKRYVKSFL